MIGCDGCTRVCVCMCARVVVVPSQMKRNGYVAAAEAIGGGGGGAYRKEREFHGAAGLNSSDAAAVRNRERWAKAGASAPKGLGPQPAEVFQPEGGVVYGGSATAKDASATDESCRSAAQARDDARRADYYVRFNQTPGGPAAGVKTMHQTGLGTASEASVRRHSSPARHGAMAVETGSALGNGVRPVPYNAFDGALGSTTRQVNSALPELKSSLTAVRAYGNMGMGRRIKRMLSSPVVTIRPCPSARVVGRRVR